MTRDRGWTVPIAYVAAAWLAGALGCSSAPTPANAGQASDAGPATAGQVGDAGAEASKPLLTLKGGAR